MRESNILLNCPPRKGLPILYRHFLITEGADLKEGSTVLVYWGTQPFLGGESLYNGIL